MNGLGWRLAWRDPWRSLLAMAGIGMAVLIAFVEMGFMNGILDSQMRTITAAQGDLVILDKRRTHLDKWDDILPIRLQQIASLPEVSAVLPVYQHGWNLRTSRDGPEKRIIVIAFSPDDLPLQLGWDQAALDRLRVPHTALFDRASRPIYGDLKLDQDIWVEGRRLRLGGFIELGPTIVIDGVLLVSESTIKALHPGSRPKMAVVRLAKGAEPAQVQRAIRTISGGDLDVYRASDLAAREAAYLRHAAPIGMLFGAGMLAGLFVGLVICYQALYVAIRRRIDAFATLKAIGFSNSFITQVVLQQTALYAAGGFLLGLALSAVAYDQLAQTSGLAIGLNAARISAIGLGCLAVCLVAGLMASRQVIKSDPAELY